MEKNARRRGRGDVSPLPRWIETALAWLDPNNVVNPKRLAGPNSTSSTVVPSGSLFSTIYAGSHRRYSRHESD
ncbi:hypothetical protein J3D46_001658 [Paenarthrobacter sp. A20]|nr:hypothetical protein [Paenarthrobacter sp. A20]